MATRILRSGWMETTLGQLGEWGSGGTPSRKNPEYFGGSIPWVKIGDLNDDVVAETEENITDLGLEQSSAKMVEPGAVFVAMYGASIGKLGIAGIRCTTNQAIAFCHVNSQVVEPAFLFWYLRAMRERLIALGKGGAQPNISQTVLKAFPIAVPPLDEQRRIVTFADDLVNRKRRAQDSLAQSSELLGIWQSRLLLHAISGTLTEGWRQNRELVPVNLLTSRSNAYDRGSRHQVALARAEAFKTETLPSSWVHAPLAEVAPLQPGYAFKSAWFSREGFRLLRGTNIVPGGTRWDDVAYLPVDRFAEFQPFVLHEGDIVIAMDRPIVSSGLKVAIIQASDLPCLLLQRVGRFQCTAAIRPRYLYYFLQSDLFVGYISGQATGTQLPHISATDVGMVHVPLPPLDEQDKIVNTLDHQFAAMATVGSVIGTCQFELDGLEQAALGSFFIDQ